MIKETPRMQDAPILTERHGRVGLIRLNRPQARNALNDALVNALRDALDDFERDDDIGCVVITGSDDIFAAGADIREMRQMDYMRAYKDDFVTRNWERLKTFRKPVIAAVSGLAVGGGCELSLMCDIIYASDTAAFGLPEVKVGIIPGAGGTQRLPRAIGKAKAMEMCLSGRLMHAVEAERAGLVTRVFPKESLLQETMAMASAIASYSLPVLMMLKESVNRAFESPLHEGLLFERRTLHATFAMQDQKEGMSAFLEKRAPTFQHA